MIIYLIFYSLVCEVMLLCKTAILTLLLVFLCWITCSVSSVNYLGVPNSTQSTENCNYNFVSFSHLLFLNLKVLNFKYENILNENVIP